MVILHIQCRKYRSKLTRRPPAVLIVEQRLLNLLKKTVDPKLKQVPFGGNLIIFSGDFQQMLPVVRQGNSKQLFHNV